MGPVTPVSIKIIGGDSASQIKNTGLSSVQPRTSKHKGNHLPQSQVAPLNSLFEGGGVGGGEKSILVAAWRSVKTIICITQLLA